MFDFALKIFLFLAPIVYWRALPLAQVQLKFFQLGVIFLFFVALSQKKIRSVGDKTLFALVSVCFFNALIIATPYSPIALTNILFAALLYYLVVCYVGNIKSVIKVFVLSLFINVAIALCQRFGYYLGPMPSKGVCGLLATNAFLGDFTAITMPFAFFIHPALILISFTGVVLAKSATAFFAMIAGLAYILYKKRFGTVYLMVLVSVVVFYSIYFREELLYKLGLRFKIWSTALDLIFERPEGWGFGSIKGLQEAFTYSGLGTADRLYNDYLEFGLCTGVIGLIALAIFLCNKLKRYRRSDKSLLLNTVFASCFIASVVCLSHSPMAPIFSTIGKSPRIAVVIITMFAMLEILLQGEKEVFLKC